MVKTDEGWRNQIITIYHLLSIQPTLEDECNTISTDMNERKTESSNKVKGNETIQCHLCCIQLLFT